MLRPAIVAWRGSAKGIKGGASWARPKLAGRDFSMWTGVGADPKWWAAQNTATLTLANVHHYFAAPPDIKTQFHKQFATPAEIYHRPANVFVAGSTVSPPAGTCVRSAGI